MATFDVESVLPETAPLIENARHLSHGSDPIFSVSNIGSLLAARASETPEKRFLTYYEEAGRAAEISYADFHAAVLGLAATMLSELGLKRGERVATLRGNDPYT